MNLDDLGAFHELDRENMLVHISGLPDQLEHAWEQGRSLSLPAAGVIKHILFTGMGGSAIGADLLATYAAPFCPVPITVFRGYDLPAWAVGRETLVVALSHSGNTEETIAAFIQARDRACQVLAITTGGALAEHGQLAGFPVWRFHHTGQPRAAVGFTFGLLLAMMHRLDLLPDPTDDLNDALHAMRNQQTNLEPDVPVAFNPAKRLAGQLVGRGITIFGADILAPVARRWKGQICENAKAWCQFETLPEADHNTLAGLNHPEEALERMIALFLVSPGNHDRNQLRVQLTQQMFMTQGINTDTLWAKGEGPMAHMWTQLQLGDYTSWYLAMMYNEDPTPVDALSLLKDELRQAG